MSEYKKMSDWAKEIGLVPKMKFESDVNDFHITIKNVLNNESINIRSNKCSNVYMAFISCFDYKYKLIYDPRSENNFKKETQMNLREQLQKNSEEYIQKEMKESKEYKDFSSMLKTELIKFSKSSPAKQKIYVRHTPNPPIERDMLKLFCAENNLELCGWTIVWA